jgi:hypothetical protein
VLSVIEMKRVSAKCYGMYVGRGADKSLAFPICSTTKNFFLGWVKEVRKTKVISVWSSGGNM